MFTTVIAWCNYAQDINYSPYLLYTSVHTYIILETEVLLLAAHDATARQRFPVEVLCPIHSKWLYKNRNRCLSRAFKHYRHHSG